MVALSKNKLKSFLLPKLPDELRKNHKSPGDKGTKEIERYLKQHFYHNAPESFFQTTRGAHDLKAHLTGRLKTSRNVYVPWLNNVRPLSGMHILEIGCGTGASTIALAEQGAHVTGIDIVENSVDIAKKRCEIYGVEASLLSGSSTEVAEQFADTQFDMIIFYASLEHMTHDERLVSMGDTWKMLAKDGLWCVIETPNRIWYFDSHTSKLPFFNWLPDDLAFKYSKFSPKPRFNELFRDIDNNDEFVSFLRKGRGVSYHEFELSMDKLENLNVVSSLSEFARKSSIVRRLQWRFSLNYQYEAFLSKVAPDNLNKGFMQSHLNLVIAKS